MTKCSYPKCEEEAKYSPRHDLHLCEEHYNLWSFMDNLMFTSKIEVNLRESRFKPSEE